MAQCREGPLWGKTTFIDGRRYEEATLNSKCFIWGAGGHAKVVAEILRLQRYEVVGFLDSLHAQRKGESFFGSQVLGGKEVLTSLLSNGIRQAIVAFGDNQMRVQAAQELTAAGFHLLTAIHPQACCATDVLLGPGTVIAPGVVIGPSSQVGKNVIINTCCSLDHDGKVGSGAHLGPGSVLAGSVHIEERAWIGAGAVVLEGRRIGSRAIVGAGSVVVENVESDIIVMGIPAKPSREVRPS